MMKKYIVSLSMALILLICSVTGCIYVQADEPTDISAAQVITAYESYHYRLKPFEPAVKVTLTADDGSGNQTTVTLVKDVDFTAEYSDNENVGVATITVTGIGNYKGTAIGHFNINPFDITSSGFKFTSVEKTMAGNEPQYKVTYKGTELKQGTDYTISSSNYQKTGYQKATVTVKGVNNFAGTKIIKASVYPNAASGLSVSKSGTTVKLSWASQASEGITGYQVYSVDSKGKNAKLVKTVRTNKAEISGLTRGKVYYYKVRAYTKSNSKTFSGEFSKTVSTFIVPSKVNAEYACKTGKKKVKAGWEETTCSGYQIKYSTNKKFKKDIHYVFAGGSKSSKTFAVGKAGKPYYVKVRAYVTYKGKKYFGPWSRKYTTAFGRLYSSYSTYYVNNPNRTTNLKIASRKICDTIVYPGETFSFNGTVGIRTAAKGYKPAPIFTGTTGHEDGVGGGVCQVASTMFNAALLGNFQIVERHQHSQRVAYTPLGRDAAIFWGSEDFKFKNTSGAAIKIKMYCADGKITCKMYSNGYKKAPKVNLSVSRSGNHFTLRRSVKGKVNYTTHSTY